MTSQLTGEFRLTSKKMHIMKQLSKQTYTLSLIIIFIWPSIVLGQDQSKVKIKKNWYFSWGYNTEIWMPSNIQISQNALGNNFTVWNVVGHDEPGWTSNLFNQPITVPQFSVRIGCFFNADHTKGLEINLDHTKYSTTGNQYADITGVINNVAVHENVQLTSEYFNYYLHNGANHLMVNYVQKVPLLRKGKPFSIEGILKTGGGIMLPHAENTIMGNDNNVGPKEFSNWFGIGKGWWRYGGYTAGIEYGIRFVPVKNAFIEITSKLAYSNMSDIPVYDGIARQELWMMEGICSLGVSF